MPATAAKIAAYHRLQERIAATEAVTCPTCWQPAPRACRSERGDYMHVSRTHIARVQKMYREAPTP